MKNKLLGVLVTLCLMLSMLGSAAFAASAAVQGSVTVSEGTVHSANTPTVYDVTVTVANNPGVSAMRLKLVFDRTNLQLVGVTDAGIFGSPIHTDSLTANPFYLYWDNATEPVSANGVVATLSFQLIGTPDTYPISLTYEAGDILNAYEDEINFTMNAGSIAFCTHSHTTSAITTQPTCTVAGVRTITCTDCGTVVGTEPVSATGHTMTAWVTVPATVKADGYRDRHCTVCNHAEHEVLPQLTTVPAVIGDDVVATGRTAQVPIRIRLNPGVNNLNLSFTLDTTKWRVVNVIDGGLFTTAQFGNTNTQPLTAHFANSTNVTQNGVLMTLVLSALTNEENVPTAIGVAVTSATNAASQAVNLAAGDGSITMPVLPRYTVTVPAVEGGTATSTLTNLLYGDEIVLTASANAGYEFRHWIIDGRIVAKSTVTWTVNDNITATPVFMTDNAGVFTVSFYSKDGRFLKSVPSNTITEADFPDLPVRYGYVATGWDINLDDGIFSDMAVYPNYTKDGSSLLNIRVTNGSLRYGAESNLTMVNAAFDTRIFVTPTVTAGFVAWLDENGRVVSTSVEYKFFATTDVVLTASYDTAHHRDYIININPETANISLSNSTYRFSVIAETHMSSDYRLIERGIVYTSNFTTEEALVIGNSGVKRKVSTSKTDGQFMYSINNAPKSASIMVRAYMIIMDQNGNSLTVYSSVCNASWKTQQYIPGDEGEY